MSVGIDVDFGDLEQRLLTVTKELHAAVESEQRAIKRLAELAGDYERCKLINCKHIDARKAQNEDYDALLSSYNKLVSDFSIAVMDIEHLKIDVAQHREKLASQLKRRKRK